MSKGTFILEQIIAKLRHIEVLISQGKGVTQGYKQAGISDVSYRLLTLDNIPPHVISRNLSLRLMPIQVSSGTCIGTSLARLATPIGCKLLGFYEFAGVVQW